MNPAHRALREGTSEAHERVDALYSQFDLTDRSGYADFLAAHAEALLPIESRLDAEGADRLVDDWAARRRGSLLLADLRDLGAMPPAAASPVAGDTGDAALAGLIYVAEGSRLGGRFLARSVPADFPRRYLDADQPADSWRKLLDRLDAILYEPAQIRSAIESAKEGFAAFERSGCRRLSKG